MLAPINTETVRKTRPLRANSKFTWADLPLRLSIPDRCQRLRERIDLRELARAELGEPRRSHGKYEMHRSPFREEKTPSFAVYANRFHDYGSGGDSGSALDFIMHLHRLDLVPAVEYLEHWAGISDSNTPFSAMPRPIIVSSPQPPPLIPTPEWQSIMRQFVAEGVDCLLSPAGSAALAYLSQSRGLNDDTIRTAQLGYNPAWRSLQIDGKQIWVAPGILIPWVMEDDLRVVRIRTRTGKFAAFLGIPEDTSSKTGEVLDKYLCATGSKPSQTIYYANGFQSAHSTVFFEGEFDALIAAQQVGDSINCVTRGSASSGQVPPRIVQRVQTSRTLYLALDNDTAGKNGIVHLLTAFPAARVLPALEIGHDPTEFIVDHQGDLRAWLMAAMESVTPPHWPPDLPDSMECALLDFSAPSLAILVRAVLYAVRQGSIDCRSFTIAELAAATYDLPRHLTARAIENGLEIDGGLFFQKLQTGESPEIVNTLINTNTHSTPPAKSGIIRNPGRPPVRYRLRPYPDCVRSLLEQRILPMLVERAFPVDDDPDAPLARTSARLLAALGDSRPEVVEDIRAQLAPFETTEVSAIYQRITQHYRDWQQRLQNMASTALPDGLPWHNARAYSAARMARLLERHPSDQPIPQRALAERCQICPRSVSETMHRAGYTADARYAEVPLTTSDAVPRPGYDPQFEGAPERITATFHDGRTVSTPIAHPSVRQTVAAWLAEGCQVVVLYRQAGIPRPMTVVEREAESERVSSPRSSRPQPTSPIVLPSSPTESVDEVPPVVIPRAPLPSTPERPPGYSPAYAEGWARAALRRLDFQFRGDRIISPDGEIFHYSIPGLIHLLRGEHPILTKDDLCADLMLDGARITVEIRNCDSPPTRVPYLDYRATHPPVAQSLPRKANPCSASVDSTTPLVVETCPSSQPLQQPTLPMPDHRSWGGTPAYT